MLRLAVANLFAAGSGSEEVQRDPVTGFPQQSIQVDAWRLRPLGVPE